MSPDVSQKELSEVLGSCEEIRMCRVWMGVVPQLSAHSTQLVYNQLGHQLGLTQSASGSKSYQPALGINTSKILGRIPEAGGIRRGAGCLRVTLRVMQFARFVMVCSCISSCHCGQDRNVQRYLLNSDIAA